MRQDLVPIRVRVKRGVKGGRKCAVYPEFNQIPSAIRQGVDWAVFIDTWGIGWHYDKVENIGSGRDEEYAITAVPEGFASAATELFPSDVRIISEAEAALFYEGRAHVRDEIERLDTEVLTAIAARVQLESLGVAPPPSVEIMEARKRCLDPADQNKSGIRANLRRTWKGFLQEEGFTIAPHLRRASAEG